MWTLERYDAWCRLRHDGFRSMNQECVRCGSLATPEEVVEYRALKEAALADAKAKGRVSYIEATYGASPPAASDIPAP